MIQFLPAQAGAFPAGVAPSLKAAQRPVAITTGTIAEGRNADFDTLFQLSSDAILLTMDKRLVRTSPVVVRLLGTQDPAQLAGLRLADLIHPDNVAQVVPRLASMVSSDVSVQPVGHRLVRADYTHALVANEAATCGHEGQLAVMLVLRKAVPRHALERYTVQARAETLYVHRLLASENAMLAQLTSNVTLSTVLRHLCLYVEQVYPNAMSALLLLGVGSQTLRAAAAPTLPAAYTTTLENSPVSPEMGTCGYAMYLGDTVFVDSIATDPRWQREHTAALVAGFASA